MPLSVRNVKCHQLLNFTIFSFLLCKYFSFFAIFCCSVTELYLQTIITSIYCYCEMVIPSGSYFKSSWCSSIFPHWLSWTYLFRSHWSKLNFRYFYLTVSVFSFSFKYYLLWYKYQGMMMVQTSAQNIQRMASQLNSGLFFESSWSSGSKHMLQLITAMVTCPGITLCSKLNIFNKINLKLHLGLI